MPNNLNPFRVLAIDPGYDRCGIAILDTKPENPREGILVYSTCITTDKSDPFEDRLLSVCTACVELIATQNPEHIALETLLFNTNQKTAMRVAEVRGALLYIAKKNNLAIFEYTPLQIKTAVTGYGRSSKQHVMDMIPKLIPFEKEKVLDDEYDAIAVGITHCASFSPLKS